MAFDLGISESEEITKIAPLLFNNAFCLWFPPSLYAPTDNVDAIEETFTDRIRRGNRISRIIAFGLCLGISREITKIAPILFNNSLCLWFPTIVICTDMIMDAIKAAVQIGSAKGTDLPPAHRNLDFQTL